MPCKEKGTTHHRWLEFYSGGAYGSHHLCEQHAKHPILEMRYRNNYRLFSYENKIPSLITYVLNGSVLWYIRRVVTDCSFEISEQRS